DQIKELGAQVVDPANFPHVERLFGPEFTVLFYEFKADIKAYLSELRNTDIRSLRDLIAFNDRHAGVEMPWFGQEIFELSQSFGPLTDDAYRKALRRAKRLAQGRHRLGHGRTWSGRDRLLRCRTAVDDGPGARG